MMFSWNSLCYGTASEDITSLTQSTLPPLLFNSPDSIALSPLSSSHFEDSQKTEDLWLKLVNYLEPLFSSIENITFFDGSQGKDILNDGHKIILRFSPPLNLDPPSSLMPSSFNLNMDSAPHIEEYKNKILPQITVIYSNNTIKKLSLLTTVLLSIITDITTNCLKNVKDIPPIREDLVKAKKSHLLELAFFQDKNDMFMAVNGANYSGTPILVKEHVAYSIPMHLNENESDVEQPSKSLCKKI